MNRKTASLLVALAACALCLGDAGLRAQVASLAGRTWKGVQIQGQPEWKRFNAHAYGVGVAVRNPTAGGGLGIAEPRLVRILDMGPDVFDLKQDLAPETAELWVNGLGPIPFANTGGGLELLVPTALLQRFDNDVEVTAWAADGTEVLHVEGLFPSFF